MKRLFLELVADEKGQDLIEYAFMSGFIIAGVGVIMPWVFAHIYVLMSKVARFIGDTTATPQENNPTIRIVCAALTAVFLGVIVLRRRNDEE